ncbi:uncharacterized protein BCR38DRAFT_41428 [Pseudomassariella vexata]|uniref:Secreted protein n=1 Tax=Pseudomassariella vexata TaxID=1141098 RepID=A0A1Y2DN31_9PEZI|nr:uncharacterized protein BCR38DRAFT_41428 [Pseudomassariella vexata]ORY60564.1 hypothetical protein BCR38DRAFT_41428 [Pseudomassariella vexata]
MNLVKTLVLIGAMKAVVWKLLAECMPPTNENETYLHSNLCARRPLGIRLYYGPKYSHPTLYFKAELCTGLYY